MGLAGVVTVGRLDEPVEGEGERGQEHQAGADHHHPVGRRLELRVGLVGHQWPPSVAHDGPLAGSSIWRFPGSPPSVLAPVSM